MPPDFRYSAYGLKIDSALELHELGEPLEALGEADLSIRVGAVACFGSEGAGNRDESRWIDPQNFWLHVDPVAHFSVSNGNMITVMAEKEADASEVRAYILGSVCGALLLQRGLLVLHGNAIRIGDACLVCVGASGAGKSTLAAGFLKRGYQILADDVVAVDGTGCAITGFPRIKLWQDAAAQLGFPTPERMRVFPDMDKFNQTIDVFEPGLRLPIRWIYLLTKGEVDSVSLEPVTGLDRFRLLRDNTYRNEYLDGHEMHAAHMRQCSQLASQVQLAKVVRPIDGFALDNLIDSLLSDVAETRQGIREI